MSDTRPEELEGIPYPDEAFNTWGAAAVGVDPLAASFTSLPYQPVRPHVPFYRFVAYPDILDLRKAGYEMDRFITLFDRLEDIRYREALQLSDMLHHPNPLLFRIVLSVGCLFIVHLPPVFNLTNCLSLILSTLVSFINRNKMLCPFNLIDD